MFYYIVVFLFILVGFLIVGSIFFISPTVHISTPPVIEQEIVQDDFMSPLPDSDGFAVFSVGEEVIYAEIAQTPQQQSKGLSGRRSLSADRGMIFVYDEPGYYHFWMREMNFPIDIIWIDENYIIVDITENFAPQNYPGTITSKIPAKYVLEVNAFWAKTNHINVGMQTSVDF